MYAYTIVVERVQTGKYLYKRQHRLIVRIEIVPESIRARVSVEMVSLRHFGVDNGCERQIMCNSTPGGSAL